MAIGKLPDSDEGGDEGESIFAEINITPLTDVFLVLVVIIMVSALAVQVEARQKQQKIVQQQQQLSDIEKRSGLKVNLPQGQAQEIDPNATSLVLEIPANGEVIVANKVMTPAELDRLFTAAFARDKATQVVLKADKTVQHGIVVNVMERAKAAGLTRLAISTSGG